MPKIKKQNIAAVIFGLIIASVIAQYIIKKNKIHTQRADTIIVLRHKCYVNNLKSIHSGLGQYFLDHNFKLPNSLPELVSSGYIAKRALVCPTKTKKMNDNDSLKSKSPECTSSFEFFGSGQDF